MNKKKIALSLVSGALCFTIPVAPHYITALAKANVPYTLVSCKRESMYIDAILEEARKQQIERQKEEERRRIEEERRQEELRQQEIQRELDRIANVGYNPYNLLEVSGITGDEMYSLLQHRGVRDVAYTIVEAENTYGINALLLAGLICLESGWGESPRSTGWTNNMSGMGVPTDHSVGTVYSSRQESVMDTARQLRKFYLTEGAENYNGLSIWDVNIKYSASGTWATKILDITSILHNNYLEMY